MTHDEQHPRQHDDQQHHDDQQRHEAAFDAPDAAQARVRDLLRDAAPTAGPMPTDVVARLDAALERARADTAVASLTQRRRARLRTVQRALAAAAGVVVLAAGGFGLVHAQQRATTGSASSGSAADSASSGSTDGGSTAVAGVPLPAGAQVLSSGTDYLDAAAAQAFAAGVLGTGSEAGNQAGDEGRTLLGAPAAPQASPEGATSEAPADPTTDASRLPVAERALACTEGLGVDPASVLAVEVASWRSRPAALVVHRTAGGAEVVVVAVDCTPGDAALSRADVPS